MHSAADLVGVDTPAVADTAADTLVAGAKEVREVHIPEADIEAHQVVSGPVQPRPAVLTPEAVIADIQAGRLQIIPEAGTAGITEGGLPTAVTTEAAIAVTTEAHIVATMVATTVDIMAAGVVTGAAGMDGRTTGTRLDGSGLAHGGGIRTITLRTIPTLPTLPTPGTTLTQLHIRPTRVRTFRPRNTAIRSNPTGTTARTRKVIFRMLKVARVDGPK